MSSVAVASPQTEPTPVKSELQILGKQSSHYLAGVVASLALGFISFPVFTRAFSVADYGIIDLIQKCILLLTAISKFGQQNSALRFFDRQKFATDPSAPKTYYSTMFFGMLLTAGLVTLLFDLSLPFAAGVLFPLPLKGVLFASSALVILRALQSTLWSFLRIEERTEAYNILNVVIKAGTIACVLFLLSRTGPTVATYFGATLLVEGLMIGAFSFSLLRRGLLAVSGFDSVFFQSSLVFGAPFILQELAGIVLDTGDRALVSYYLGAGALGLYSVAYGLATYVNTLIITPLNLALLPIYMRLWNTEGPKATAEFLTVALDCYIACAFGIFVVASAAASDLVVVLASAKYHEADQLIPMLVAGFLIYTSTVFLNAGLVIKKQTRSFGFALLWSAIVNLVLNVLLLPVWQLEGAALANLISYVFCVVLLARSSRTALPLPIRYRGVLVYTTAGAIAYVLALNTSTGSSLGNLFAKTSVATLAYVLFLWTFDQRARQFLGYIASAIRPARPE